MTEATTPPLGPETPTPLDPVTFGPYAVPVRAVLDLIPTVKVEMSGGRTQHGDTVRDGERYLQAAHIEGWIMQVSARVSARLVSFALIRPDRPFYKRVLVSAYDVVANGAASYAYAAAAPEKAGMVDSTSYAEVLWRRYQDGLDELVAFVDDWLKAHPEDSTEDAGYSSGAPSGGRFPRPVFRDSMRW